MPVDIRAPSPLPIIFLERETLTNRIKYEFMVIGVFEAYKKTIHEDPSIEIVLLSLPQPMEAIELYKLTKPPHHFTPTGSRPKSGISVDGLLGVKYFFSYVVPEENKKYKWYRFLRVFLSENTDAWMISCSCSSEKFIQYRPVFDRIISSFKRAH